MSGSATALGRVGDTGRRWLKRPREKGTADIRLFCFHAGGSATPFRKWPRPRPDVLAEPGLLQTLLPTLEAKSHIFVLVLRHIVADGWAARRLASGQRASLLAVLHASVLTVLHRWTGQEALPTGSVFNGRTRPEVEPLVGYFVNRSGTPQHTRHLSTLAGILTAVLRAGR